MSPSSSVTTSSATTSSGCASTSKPSVSSALLSASCSARAVSATCASTAPTPPPIMPPTMPSNAAWPTTPRLSGTSTPSLCRARFWAKRSWAACMASGAPSRPAASTMFLTTPRLTPSCMRRLPNSVLSTVSGTPNLDANQPNAPPSAIMSKLSPV